VHKQSIKESSPQWLREDLQSFYTGFIQPLQALMSNRLSAKGRPTDMSTQEVFVQQFARRFHHYRETLSPEMQQDDTPWNAIPTEERRRLVAAARLVIVDLETNTDLEDDARRYFAKPGEAEWGC
jgi:hypothetical protein